VLILTLFFNLSYIISQSGTFDFETATKSTDDVISETIDGVILSVFSDSSNKSMSIENWNGYPPFTGDVATMYGAEKPTCTFTFNQTINITSIFVSDYYGSINPHILITANNGSTYDMTIDGYNGSFVPLNFLEITSFVITNYDGGNIALAFDHVTMDAALPVELTTFTTYVSGSSVELMWKTATEVNNYGFEIQRNTSLNFLSNGDNEERGVWETIGFVNGSGNSNSPKTFSYNDEQVLSGKHFYRLKQIDIDGSFDYSDAVEVSVMSPAEFSLKQNYPNPFNPVTTIKYSIPENVSQITDKVSLIVYDLIGTEVDVLVNENQSAGNYEVLFDASNLSSGVYFYKLQTENINIVKKLTLIK